MLRVKVLVSFNGLTKGTTGTVEGEDSIARARAYAAAGLMQIIEVTDDGTNPGGPGGPATGDPGREPSGTGEDGTPGGEPGEDPVSG